MTLAVIVRGIRSKVDRSLSLNLETQEVTPQQAGELYDMNGKLCAVYITEKESIPQEVIDQVDEADIDLPGKSQSQRLRSVLYVLFTQDTEGHTDFDQYYHAKTEKIINHLKSKIK